MALLVPLPESLRARIAAHRGGTHPGLLLDKYVESWEAGTAPGKLSEKVQKPTVQAVAAASQNPPPGLEWQEVLDRRRFFLEALPAARARIWFCVTTGPLTLHLARASALENAGICLHPVYGFAYLPGSGLKGMAHAYACEVWLP